MNLIFPHPTTQTSSGDPRGYVQPHSLSELWFHVGTACNLSCPFCLEGSKPGDTRLSPMTLADVKPIFQEALTLGVERFSFTGGEPFVIRSFVDILQEAVALRPCLVLTNGTKAMTQRIHQFQHLRTQPIQLRISLDYPCATKHNQGRGEGAFEESIEGIRALSDLGFEVSVARQMAKEEDTASVENQYKELFRVSGISESTPLVAFPDFLPPGSSAQTPEISENCMTQYHTPESRRKFMCAYSKMAVKINGQIEYYACTLVDDDARFSLGASLTPAVNEKIYLHHHRCYSCFAYGASCSG